MKRTNSIISMTMIFLILFITILPNFAICGDSPSDSKASTDPKYFGGSSGPDDSDRVSKENYKKIYISSADELIAFSENCSYDRFSQNSIVFLEADIDLSEKDFLPIPIFAGVFDGQGHTVSGLNIEVEGSNQGFFRYLMEDGVIKNLKLKGLIKPQGDKKTIGGIVGNNKGLVENCEFSGYINAKDTVGGLVGWNSTSGKIINSSFSGVAYGDIKVGGIAGYNAGTILRCANYSSVNTTVEDHKLSLSDIIMDNISLTKLVTDATDIGGIAGINTGVIQTCENRGVVGYPHVGYNIGGIAGRQRGYITNCVNYENIYGRKEVAGIVGQIEPHISTIVEKSKLQGLQRELDDLDTSITKMVSGIKGFSKVTSQNLSSLENSINTSKGHASSLIEQTESIINDGIEELDKISIIAIEVLDRLSPLADSITNIEETMESVRPLIEELIKDLDRLMEDSPEINENIKAIFSSLKTSLNKILENEGTITRLNQDILKAIDLLQSGNIEGLDLILKDISVNLEDIGKILEDEVKKLEPLIGNLKNIIESTEGASVILEEVVDSISEIIIIIEPIGEEINKIIETIDGVYKYISEQEDIQFETDNDLYQKTSEDLYGSINDVTASISELIKDMDIEGNKLIDDMQGVSSQLFKTMKQMIKIIEEISLGDISEEDIVRDVSSDDIEKKTKGKVSECKNMGDIDGDINVGGISGGMSIELTDPEVDLNLKGKLSYNTVFETRAIILRCENIGSILAKKDNVGGIVGSMDLGYLRDCTVLSSIESSDGNYVGGIAGKSDAPIVSSYSRSSLKGGNYIGGIAGLGKEIKNSYSLSKVDRARAYIGAIAGNVDESSNIKDNFFVSEDLRGIDGISYMKKAEPITYEELMARSDLPNIFKNF